MPAGAEQLILEYGLVPHPEGGYYREAYRSGLSIGVPEGYPGRRVALTVIYFLLQRGDFSAFHRVRGEEVWAHLAGDSLELVVLDQEPHYWRLSRPGEGGTPVAVVPPGDVQAARPLGDWVLATCVVAPGFEFADFEMPTREELLRRYPSHLSVIRSLTRDRP